MTTVNIYLTFNGNCEEAFQFYKSIFGGAFDYVGRFRDMPPASGAPAIAEAHLDKIMHVSLPISKETTLMGSDTFGEWATSFIAGNNFSISIQTDQAEETTRLFNGLAEGGRVTMPLGKTFWSEQYGMLTDRFGINWMVSLAQQTQQA